MVAALLLACGGGAAPTVIADAGCACLEPGPVLKVHLACVDCPDEVRASATCSVESLEDRMVVHASAELPSCPAAAECAPLVVTCTDVPLPAPGVERLVYGGAEVPLSLPLPRTPVCACPGGMAPRE